MTKIDPHPEPYGVFCLLPSIFLLSSAEDQRKWPPGGTSPGAGQSGLSESADQPPTGVPAHPLALVARPREQPRGKGSQVSALPPGTAAYRRRRPSPPSSEPGCTPEPRDFLGKPRDFLGTRVLLAFQPQPRAECDLCPEKRLWLVSNPDSQYGSRYLPPLKSLGRYCNRNKST